MQVEPFQCQWNSDEVLRASERVKKREDQPLNRHYVILVTTSNVSLEEPMTYRSA